MKQIQPGVFYDPQRDLVLFAHRFFRRSLSHRNKLNDYFLLSFHSTATELGATVTSRLRLDPDVDDSIVARTAPSVSRYIAQSGFPHPTAAYFVLSAVPFLPYLVSAMRCPLVVLHFGSVERMEDYKRRYQARSGFQRVVGILFCFAAIWIAWLQPGYQYGLLPVNDKRWVLAIGGPLFSFYFACYFFLNGGVS